MVDSQKLLKDKFKIFKIAFQNIIICQLQSASGSPPFLTLLWMNSYFQDERSWLDQYKSQDLVRALVRQYLYQHDMFKTLHCFEAEDAKNQKKIVKSTLIKMLSMSNLVVSNRSIVKERQAKSLLLILVQYLRGKFQEKITQNETSQTSKNLEYPINKEISMNGDKASQVSSKLSSNNIIKQNFIGNKSQTNDKTLTGTGFYKNKELSKNQKDNQKINQQKKHSNRPSTAKPSIKPSKQQQKVSAIYQKVIKNDKSNKSPQTDDVFTVDIKNPNFQNQEQKMTKKLSQKQKTPLIDNQLESALLYQKKNSAIDRSMKTKSRIQQESKVQNIQKKQESVSIKQSPTNKNLYNQTKKQAKLSQLKISQDVSAKISQMSEKTVNNNYQMPDPQIKQRTAQIAEEQIQEENKKVEEEYFDQFEEDNTAIVSKKQPQQQDIANQQFQSNKVLKEHIVKESLTNKHQPSENQRVQENIDYVQQKNQPKGKMENGETTQPIQKNLQSEKKASRKQETKEDKVTQNTQLQKPEISTGTRGMKKLLRKTGKQISKEQNATEVIGKDVKLLPNDIRYQIQSQQQDQKKILQTKKSQKVPCKDQFKQKVQKQAIQTQFKPNSLSNLRQQSILSGQSSNISGPPSNMIKLKKKPKNTQNAAEQQSNKMTKFKFDENFIDQPLHANKETYNYEKFSFEKLTIKPELKPKKSNIILQTKINYNEKPTGGGTTNNLYSSNSSKQKKNERQLSAQSAEELKNIVFQKGSHYLAKAWHQGFILSPFKQTFFGLKQIEGGPCGIIAAVQCYFLKHIMYLSKPTSENDLTNQMRRQNCLVAALADLLWKVKGDNQKVILVVPANKNFTGIKLQIFSLLEVEIQASSFESVYQNVLNYKSSFIGQSNHGVTLIVYSIVMTKGIQNIYREVDMKENPLIGHHGHCTQELVNLFITGRASSNCFDGKKELQQGFTLQGVQQKSQFGFLTVFQTLEYIEVGKHLKNPLFPIWIISKQFHYHVTFGNHYLISQNNDCEKFDLMYFDGLYACDKFIRLTFDKMEKDEFGIVKQQGDIKNLPLIEQVLLKKWGRRQVDWNGSVKIL